LVKRTWYGYVPLDGGNVSEVSAEQSITTFLVRVDVLSLEVFITCKMLITSVLFADSRSIL
jgi:hypothetical protein